MKYSVVAVLCQRLQASTRKHELAQIKLSRSSDGSLLCMRLSNSPGASWLGTSSCRPGSTHKSSDGHRLGNIAPLRAKKHGSRSSRPEIRRRTLRNLSCVAGFNLSLDLDPTRSFPVRNLARRQLSRRRAGWSAKQPIAATIARNRTNMAAPEVPHRRERRRAHSPS